MSEKRPSPSESATLFKIGTIKKGNDNNMWIIAENKNGVKHWKKHTNTKESFTKIKNDVIVEFKLNTVSSFTKIGKLPIESNVVIGEYNYAPNNGFTKFKKGTYYIYKVDDDLVLSNANVTKNNVADTLWKDTGESVGVDGGMFGFWDLKYLKALSKFNKSKFTNIPHFNDIFDKAWYKKSVKDTGFIKIKDFNDADKFIANGFDGEKIVGVISGTGIGDGVFNCYSNGNNTMLLLMGGRTSINIGEEAENSGMMEKRKTRTSRRTSRRTSKKPSRKASKKINKKPSRKTNKKSSRKPSKKTSKKTNKK